MYRRRLQESKHKKVQSWEKKTHRSPFLINLLAEVRTMPQRISLMLKDGLSCAKNRDTGHCNAICGVDRPRKNMKEVSTVVAVVYRPTCA